MYMVTAEEMRELDRYTIDKLGIPVLTLMENAGRAVADEVLKLSHTVLGDIPGHGGVIRTETWSQGRHDLREREHWYILVGKGNNGGDGLVAAAI